MTAEKCKPKGGTDVQFFTTDQPPALSESRRHHGDRPRPGGVRCGAGHRNNGRQRSRGHERRIGSRRSRGVNRRRGSSVNRPGGIGSRRRGEAAELTYIYPGTIFTDVGVVQDALNTILQERINATISLQTVDWGAFDEKIKLATAAGEKFDMTFTAPWINNYYQNVSNGNLLALDDMLQTQAPKLWDSMPAAFWDAARVDGKIHGVINQQIFVKPWGPFTRKDLAEKHGLDLSAMSKFEDLEPYFDKVKAEGITPVTRFSLFFNEYWGYDPLFDGGFVVRYDDPERKVLIAAETPEFKAAMELNRKWLAAGYMLEEELSADDERAQVRAGQYGGGIHVIKPGGESEAKATYGFDYVQRSFVAPHNGTEVLTTAGVVATLNGVSRTSANPERVVQFLELLNTDVEVYNLLCKGVEGKHWEWKDETRKIVGFPEGVTAETSAYNPNTDWMFGNQFNAYFVSEEQASANVWEETAKLNTSATPSVALGFSFNSDPVKTELASSPRSAKSKASWLPTVRTSCPRRCRH